MPPVTTPIPFTIEELDAVVFNADGLVPAIIQEQGTNHVLMFAWMNRRGVGAHARDGPYVVLEPEPPGVLVQGGDLG